ncbi:hypothetical protein [Massilibacteroides sp.]|uniref:hypothetical protein n=1 Tax=Massilibacteroides sp. TaxID=2034766 RepID=UPI002636A660|nr:hypothetical protein [Massilibacteroides sp.]MDD4515723.1 hypothetical protein [Massilibacteroides sp.]
MAAAKNKGWVSIYRDIRDHWIWQDPVKLKWWLDILLTVNHEDSKVNIGMQLIDCKRGQSVMSLSTWAKRWGVSKDSTRNFFNLLKKDGMINVENLKKSTRITVCNYDSYQDGLHDGRTRGKRKPNAEQTQAETNNKLINKDNNDNNDNNPPKGYEGFSFDFLDENFSDLFFEWLSYKSGRKEKYKTQQSLELCYKNLIKLSWADPISAKKITEQSMANNWAGLFELKSKGKQETILKPKNETERQELLNKFNM